MPLKITDLPIEFLLDYLLPTLPTESILNLAQTNRFFAKLCGDDTFWKLKLKRDYNFTANADTARDSGFKIIYRGIRKPSVYTWGDAGQDRLGLASLPRDINYVGGVPYPVKVDINARIVSLVAGGWCFHALDDLGRIHVWGQLDGEQYAMRSDGFSQSSKPAPTPHRLRILHPEHKDREVKFTAISTGRGHSAALAADRNVWVFTSWGRPILYNAPEVSPNRLKDRDQEIIQVESGWMFVSMLNQSGDVFVVWPFAETEDFGRDARHRNTELDDGDGSDAAKALMREENGDKIIPCTPITVSASPLRLPPIPNDLPDLHETALRSSSSADVAQQAALVEKSGDELTKLVRIGAGDNFIIGLTNKGHVLAIDVSGGDDGPPRGPQWLARAWRARQKPGWVYLPQFSDVEKVKENEIFTTAQDGRHIPEPPNTMRITHISAHFQSFAAYSISSYTSPHASIVLHGHREDESLSDSVRFIQTIYPRLLSEPVIALGLGDYHRAALTNDGRLLTWGQSKKGALGLGHPVGLEAGAPGGYVNEADRVEAVQGRSRGQPPDVTEPSEVTFDWDGRYRKQTISKKFVINVAASGWHTGALVIDLGGEEPNPLLESGPSITEEERLFAEWSQDNAPHPQPGFEPYQAPPFNPGGGGPGAPHQMPIPPFSTHGPNAPLRHGPVSGMLGSAPFRVGFAGRGARRGGDSGGAARVPRRGEGPSQE